MNFIAFLVGLGLERLLSGQLHIRDPQWLLGYLRGGLTLCARSRAASIVTAVLVALGPGLVVGAALSLPAVGEHPLIRLAVAAVVLFFSLGPRDLKQEVNEYRAALLAHDSARAAALSAEILGHDAGQRQGQQLRSVAEAVFVQANSRLFGVLFWFALAGPVGAITFRVTDLLRRVALGRAERADAPPEAVRLGDLFQRIHGVLAFVPARLLALSYGVAGSFEESFTGWRGYLAAESDHFFDANDRLLLHAGQGALGARWEGAPSEEARTGAALALTAAAFYVWLAVFALLTVAAYVS